MRRAVSWLVAWGALAALGGCGDAALWNRYRAERDFWKARVLLDAIERAPDAASESDVRRADRAFQRIAESFPPPGGGAAPDSGYSEEVMILSGRAANARARLLAVRGRDLDAEAAYARVERDYSTVLVAALEAAQGRAEALERAGRTRDAADAFVRLSRSYPLADARQGTAQAAVLDAPAHAARLLVELGDRAAAEQVLRDAAERCERAIAHWSGKPVAPQLWLRLSEARGALGEFDPALVALRRALHEPGGGAWIAPVLLGLADRSLQCGRPDSALVYAAWAEHDLRGPERGRAIFLCAQAWERTGRPDSALGAYERYLEDYPQNADSSALARYRRGDLLERSGRWEQGRSEFHALAGAFPSHELGFAALLRLVRHHADRGERELAELEGRRALETIDQVIAGYRDPDVQIVAQESRAELLLLLENPSAAIDAFTAVWRSNPRSSRAARCGLRAAELAERNMRDSARAVVLYGELAARARDAGVRRQAGAALERLRHGRS